MTNANAESPRNPHDMFRLHIQHHRYEEALALLGEANGPSALKAVDPILTIARPWPSGLIPVIEHLSKKCALETGATAINLAKNAFEHDVLMGASVFTVIEEWAFRSGSADDVLSNLLDAIDGAYKGLPLAEGKAHYARFIQRLLDRPDVQIPDSLGYAIRKAATSRLASDGIALMLNAGGDADHRLHIDGPEWNALGMALCSSATLDNARVLIAHGSRPKAGFFETRAHQVACDFDNDLEGAYWRLLREDTATRTAAVVSVRESKKPKGGL